MTEAWSVVVTREPEWDDVTRAEAISAVAADEFKCQNCGVPGALEEVTLGARVWTWGDGRKFLVRRFRCLACAAEETVRRDFEKSIEDVKPQPNLFAPGDGIRFLVEEEVIDDEHTP